MCTSQKCFNFWGTHYLGILHFYLLITFCCDVIIDKASTKVLNNFLLCLNIRRC